MKGKSWFECRVLQENPDESEKLDMFSFLFLFNIFFQLSSREYYPIKAISVGSHVLFCKRVLAMCNFIHVKKRVRVLS